MKRLTLLVLIAALVAAFFLFDLGRFLTLDALKDGQATFAVWYDASPWLVAGAYFLIYVAVTALSLPGAAVMTLAGGALFGLGIGTLLVSFASSIGATLAFLVSRFLLARLGPGPLRRASRCDQPGDGEGRRLLSLHPAPGAGLSLLPHQPADGAHPHPDPHLLLGEPGGDAGGDPGLCERRDPARPAGEPLRHPLAGAPGLLRPAGGLPAAGEAAGGLGAGAQGLRGLEAARSASTATWWSSAPGPGAWSPPTSPPR